ncbi:hypothetical_protein [Candidozyma auris]|uniref:double-stranded DNA-dependent ATPase n=1 Tax=Candidozyma auris TaxID=498019 RepID=UPI000D297B65|nr:double-stranded DNA-dependent ATPase [[Candida] auris]QEO20866.1 hypothetical_protein [[Candida] auris]GBL48616.1 putative DNA phosphorothioation system restriction enzyme [[Candida] auris]
MLSGRVIVAGIRLLRYPIQRCSSKFVLSIAPYSVGSEIKLRDYQETAVHKTLSALERGLKRPAIVLATGGGKTVVMSHLIPQLKSINTGDKVLVLAHKQELVRQAASTISKIIPGARLGIDMSTSKPDIHDKDIVVASVPTLVYKTRLDRYNPADFKAIILDECHHATAHSWMKILKHFQALDEGSKIYVIGFTATLERADGISLGQVFQEIVFERNLITMIRARELCDVRLSKINVDIDWSKLRTHQGDFVQKELAEVVNKDDINVTVTRGLMQLKKKHNLKSTLVFCVDIAHCKTLCGVLQRNGVKAQYVTGNTVAHERRAILEDFRRGEIEVLCNVLVFTEGTDIPNIDSLVLARPTQSKSLLIQMIGRGLRLHQDKSVCNVIDMVDATRHGFNTTATLLGIEKELQAKGMAEDEITSRMEELLDNAVLVNAAENEQKRLDEERQVFEVSQRLKHLGLKFETIEGFAELEKSKTDKLMNSQDINQALRNSKVTWARLGYSRWGVSVGRENFVINREEDQFVLSELTFVPLEVIFASKFKSDRFRLRPIRKSNNIKELILAAENILYGKVLRSGFKSRPVTTKQVNFIVSKLKAKAKTIYDKTPEDIASEVCRWRLGRASNLILAAKISVNSLWVKWELAHMFGYSKDTEGRIKKMAKQIDKDSKLSENFIPRGPGSRVREAILEAERALGRIAETNACSIKDGDPEESKSDSSG